MRLALALCLCLLAPAVRAAGPPGEPVPEGGADERARRYVELALRETLDEAATRELVRALDDPDETARLAASVAACHSSAVGQSVFVYALGNVHTSIRPALKLGKLAKEWNLTPEKAEHVISSYLPAAVPPAALARLRTAAVDIHYLTRDASHFLLCCDARRNPAVAQEVDALIADTSVNACYRLELAAMCLDRVGLVIIPLLEASISRDGYTDMIASMSMLRLISIPGGAAAVGGLIASPTDAVAEMAARVMVNAVPDNPAARAALKAAWREEIRPNIRTLIEEETEKLKRRK